MTPTTLAETILRDVPTSIDGTGVWLDYGAAIEALTAALDPAIAERAGEVLERLNGRTVKRLAANWKEGRKCPECDADATRQKCMWEMGGACPRHDPSNYEPSPYETVPDRDCKEAADLITAVLAQNAALRAERDEAREELADLKEAWNRDNDVIDAQSAQIAALTARVERLRAERDQSVQFLREAVHDLKVEERSDTSARGKECIAFLAALTTEEGHE